MPETESESDFEAHEEQATHGDSDSAGRILQDADGFDEDARATDGGESDEELNEDR